MPQLSFFIGKGGVGKTTVSSAYAVHNALHNARKPVLLISTDPAHSLADILQVRLGDSPQKIPMQNGELFAWQIKAEKQFQRFLDKYREGIFGLLESGTIFTRAEIEPLLSGTLPGMAEIAALLAISDLLKGEKYKQVVVDTAPVGHTLRLFEMPERFQRFLDFLNIAGSRDAVLAATFGGSKQISHAFLAEWRGMIAAVQQAFSSKPDSPNHSKSESSRLFLITTPETFSLNESVRTARALAEGPTRLGINAVVLNRVVSSEENDCKVCLQRARATRSAQFFLKKHFSGLPLLEACDSGAPIMGTAALAAFGEHVFAGKKLRLPQIPAGYFPEPLLRPAHWPQLDSSLTFTLGKGGVGKTTISAALAFHKREAQPKTAVTICSTDPAPSLDDVFLQEVEDRAAPVLGDPLFLAAEIDSVAEFRTWSDEIKQKINHAFSSEQRGVHLDLSFDRRIFSALLDIVPPGVDEIFAIFRILCLLENSNENEKNVIIDMAPTGHALELLRMPDRMLLWTRMLLKSLAQHRTLPLAQDVAVEVAQVQQRFRELSALIKDARRSQTIPVMLAEPLPDRETGRLLAALQSMQIHVSPLVVNRILFSKDIANCHRCQLARSWQMKTLAGLRKRLGYKGAIYLARNFPREIAGRKGLQSFTQELWQLDEAARNRKFPSAKNRKRNRKPKK